MPTVSGGFGIRFELQLWDSKAFVFSTHCLIKEGKFLKSDFRKNEWENRKSQNSLKIGFYILKNKNVKQLL